MKKYIAILFIVISSVASAQTPIVRIVPLWGPNEEVTNLLMTLPYTYFVAYGTKVDTIWKGSIIEITSHGEATNNYAYNVGVGGYLCYGKDSADFGATSGIYLLDHATGEDIIDYGTQGHNHIKIDRNVSYYTGETIIGKWINLVLYAYSSSAAPGDYVTLMQGYGSLRVTIHSPK